MNSNVSESHTNSTRQRWGSCCCWLIALPAIAIVGYSAIRYFIDQSTYNKGYQAYQQADCAVAIQHFGTVINGWRLVDIGGYPALAQQGMAECLPFQAAVDKQQAGDLSETLVAYSSFVSDYSDSTLAEAARNRIVSLFEQSKPSALAGQGSCQKIDLLLEKDLIPQRDVNLPTFYLACGQFYDTGNNQQSSFVMYLNFLTEYPNHFLAAEAEANILANPSSCKAADSIQKNSVIASRQDFMPSLYYRCGQAYEDDGNWVRAITMYENFLAEYPSHSLASNIEAALARSVVALARASGAEEIPEPERSGSTASGIAEVIIQNDSTERLRIVFSGPESRVEELGECSSCSEYEGKEPLFCPEKGPIGRYILEPGLYDVVVESISDSGTTPWTGNWRLVSGDEYYSCFFIVIEVVP